jgi:hypothetical protein
MRPSTRPSVGFMVLFGVVFAIFAAAMAEAYLVNHRRAELEKLVRDDERLRAEIHVTAEQEKRERDFEARQAQVAGQQSAPIQSMDQELVSTMRVWLDRVDQVRAAFAARPNLMVPELALLTNEDWFDVVPQAKLESEEDIRATLTTLRGRAEVRLATRLSEALQAYLSTHEGVLPNTVHDLLPQLGSEVTGDWLNRYHMLHTGKVTELSSDDQQDLIRPTPVDPDRDRFVRITVNGAATGSSAAIVAVREAQKAFAAAHAGARATTASELVPYLPWPVSPLKAEAVLRRPTPSPKAP